MTDDQDRPKVPSRQKSPTTERTFDLLATYFHLCHRIVIVEMRNNNHAFYHMNLSWSVQLAMSFEKKAKESRAKRQRIAFSCTVYFNYDSRDKFCSQIRKENGGVWFECDLDMTDTCMRCFEKHFAVRYHCDEMLCIQCAHSNGCIDCKAIYCL